MAFDVPESCTLPTAEQPVRAGEFEALFTSALRGRERLGDRHLRLTFVGGDALVDQVRDLVARESECCSFFEFTVTTGDGRVLLDVTVPAAHAHVLDGLDESAAHASAGAPR